MDGECGAVVASFLSLQERRELRAVSRRWLFTCPWLQFNDSDEAAGQSRNSVWNLRSRAFRHEWTTFIRNESHSFLPHLLELLPAIAITDTMELKKRLCLSTTTGRRPSFTNTHARSGYIQQKINRCGNLPNLLLTAELSELRSKMFRSRRSGCWNMALYGGGPAYDVLGLIFMREYFRAQDVEFRATVYDNEPGWKCAIDAVEQTFDRLGQRNISLSFQHCDITLDMCAAENDDVRRSLGSTNLHLFSFVCVENFCLLRDSAYVFLQSLFSQCSDGSYFILTDSTHRLWPAIFHVANTIAPDRFRVSTPYARSCHYALVLEKLPSHSKPAASSYPFYTQAMHNLQDFQHHQQHHLDNTEKNGPTRKYQSS
uniref:F-box domain-containing protein n=1 Tax=Hyaloperonospora arabidopsidis (strain Emoy2) TaxID=559515 RepID=M4C5A2_HYAAE